MKPTLLVFVTINGDDYYGRESIHHPFGNNDYYGR